ncbi:MAG: hypothetical protein MJ211_00020 [Bacteroidales bacterium]|nr:hypothetical protein [Bacteroidales bacterium]
MNNKLFLIIFFILFYNISFSQNPFSTKWNYIQTPHVKIISDDKINKNDVYRIANSLNAVFESDTVSLKDNPRKIPLVLSNNLVTSNGYVTLFPYKMEFYGLPMNNSRLGIGEWYQNLSVHEYRHVVQNQILNHGFIKFAGVLCGAYGRSAMRMSVPTWWMEGDAVYAETVLTTAGRGRVSSFNVLTASILDSRKKNYPYDKMVNGSFRNELPDKYEYGYLLVTRARNQFGKDIWTKTSRRMSWYPFLPWAFGASFDHFSGENLTKNYKNTMNELRNFYSSRIENLNLTEAKIINTKKKHCFTSYSNPKFINDSILLAVKSSMSKTSTFVLVKLSGQEFSLFETDASDFDYNNNKIVWSTIVPDIRWTEQTFSDISLYDFKTSKKYRLTKKGRYFSPTISKDGKTIATVEFDEKRDAYFVVFKLTENNNGLLTISHTDKYKLQYGEYIRGLKFINDNKVAMISNYHNQNSLIIKNIQTGETQTLIDYSDEVINKITSLDNKIIYDSEYSGISNIWSIDIESLKSEMLTSRKYSASSPSISPNGKYLVYSDYTAMGKDIAFVELYNNKGVKKEEVKPQKLEYFSPMLKYEPSGKLDTISIASTSDSNYQQKKYNKLNDLIRIYGWMPNLDNEKFEATLMSQNTLGTFNVSVNETYRFSPDYWRTRITTSYSGLYPVLSLGAEFLDEADKYLVKSRLGQISSVILKWKSRVLSGSVSLPLNFSRYNYSQKMNISLGLSNYQTSEKLTESVTDIGNGNFNTFHGSINYSLSNKKAERDFMSTLGLNFNIDIIKSLNYRREAEKYKASLSITIPGFFRQNTLTVKGTVMKQSQELNVNKLYLFADSDLEVRGYSSVRMQKVGKLASEYWFPMGYPDIGIPAFIWLKRIRGAFFADVASAQILGYRYDFASIGGKMLFDVNLFRISNNVNIGFSYSYPLVENYYQKKELSLILSYEL